MRKLKLLSILALLLMAATGAVAQTTYTVTVMDGTEGAAKWLADPNPATAGQTVTVTYNGTKKVKSVKAKKNAAATTPSLNLTSPAVGQVIGDDGKNYAYASLPSGVTAVALIWYVSGSNGLALALSDEGKMNWATAVTTCAAHTPAFENSTWKLPTIDEWNNMCNGAGGYATLRNSFSGIGGTNLKQDSGYWSLTENSSNAYIKWFDDGSTTTANKAYTGGYARACLAF